MIGAVGGLIAAAGVTLIDLIKVDDPVGAVSVHGFGGIWVRCTCHVMKIIVVPVYGCTCMCVLWSQGMLSVGLLMDNDPICALNRGNVGLFHGGGFYSLGVQLLAVVCIIAWSAFVTLLFLLVGRTSSISEVFHSSCIDLLIFRSFVSSLVCA